MSRVDLAGRFDPATEIDLPPANSHTAVLDHVLDCLAGRATSRLTPAGVLASQTRRGRR